MDDYQAEGLATGLSHIARDLRAVEDELKKIRMLMSADLLLKTYQHTEEDDIVKWPIGRLLDIVETCDLFTSS